MLCVWLASATHTLVCYPPWIQVVCGRAAAHAFVGMEAGTNSTGQGAAAGAAPGGGASSSSGAWEDQYDVDNLGQVRVIRMWVGQMWRGKGLGNVLRLL